jgi:ribonuclease R
MMAKKKTKQKHNWHDQDPYFSREKEKYGHPVPSREFIVDYLNERGMTLSWRALCAEWNLNDKEADALERRLKAMERDGELIRNRRQGYGVVSQMELIKGRVIGHPEGYGFLHPDDGSEDMYISPRQMRQLLHGDRVVMRLAGVDRRGRREAALVEVLERNTLRVVGRFFRESGIGFVVPDNRRVNQDVMIPPDWQSGVKPGQIVVAELIEQPTKQHHPIGRITEVLGDHMAPGMEVQIAIVSYDIPTEWPPAVDDEIERLDDAIPASALENRLDLRNLPLVTIDGIHARDFDDAVYCERRGNNWRLLVAIADVAWYVHPYSALDREALHRGTSVYFPDRVIPMLPEVLSNGLCSLNPDVDRLCMVCDMTINPAGKIIRSRFSEAVMRSHARLTYDAVAAMLVQRDRRIRRQYKDLLPHLDNLYALFQILQDAREQRGTIDFDTQETVIEYDSAGKIERIMPSERNDAHRLIEECMITANIAAARFLQRHRIPSLYRIHQGPSAEKLERLHGFLRQLGLSLGTSERPSAMDCARLLERARDRADFHLIQTVLLRSLSQAVYSPDNSGHFGLALEGYAHFTSPIRRYPDLLVHRAIRHILQGGKADNFYYSHSDMIEHGEHTSMTERRADEATRDAAEWLKCEYMLDKVGEAFDGIVSGVTAFGLFIELQQVFVEGLLHVTSLPNDYYHFDPVGHFMRGKRTGKTYRLGDAIKIVVARVDLDERKIDFELAQQSAKKSGRRRKK